MYLNGRVGQVIGPFESGKDLLAKDGAISVFTEEITKPILSKLGIQTNPGVNILLNNKKIKIGNTGIYELDGVVSVKSLIFIDETDENTLVDFIY